MTDPVPINSKRLIAINSAIKYVTLAVVNVVAFLLTPYLIHALGTTLLGLKTLAYQALQFVGLAHTAMGISYERYAKVNFAVGDHAEMNSNLSAGLLVSAASALLFALGSVVLAVFAGPLFGLSPDIVSVARWVFVLIGFSTAFLILTGVWETPAFVTERLYLTDLGQLVCAVAGAAGVVLIFQSWRPSIIVWVLLSNGLLVLWRVMVMMPMARRLLPSFRVGPSLIKSSGQVRELMMFGGLNFIGGVGYLLYYASDSIIISNLPQLGPDMIVYYNVAQRWDPQIRVLVMAFVGSMLPHMTSLVSLGQRDRMASAFLRGTRYSLLIGILPAALLVMFAGPFLRHWVGEDFARVSGPVLQLIMLQFLACLPERMAYNVNLAYGRMSGPVVVSLLCGVLNIVLSIVLVRQAGMGLLGIATGSVVALVIVSAYSIGYALRLMHMPVSRWFGEGCFRAALTALPLAATGMLLPRIWPACSLLVVLLQFAVCSVIYAVSAWLLGLTRLERSQVADVALRILRRAQGGP